MLDKHQIEHHIDQVSILYLLTKYLLLATKVHDQKNLQIYLLRNKQLIIVEVFREIGISSSILSINNREGSGIFRLRKYSFIFNGIESYFP